MVLANNYKYLLLHIVIILLLSIGIVITFFYVYLPNTTNHGETVEVPGLDGMNLKDLETFLDQKSLRYQVNDCTYVKGKKPLTILSQYPKAGTKVKENRRIYVSVTAVSPPKVKMPNLIDASLKNAQLVLQSYDLILDKIKFVPHFAKNAVLKQYLGTKEIKPGEYLPKGSLINIVVGDGLGTAKVLIPNLVGSNISEAGGILESLQLEIGSVSWEETSSEESGTIIKQKPSFAMGDSIQKGHIIDVWVAGSDPKRKSTSNDSIE
ncbi:MAG: PASTA domain-containing protein [Opitutaceae bacterium]|nr:PASTA domain-containing protein [Cytophagales bacterium]